MKLRDAKRLGNLSDEQKAELATMSAKELGSLEEIDVPPNPMDPFADEAANRLEQDLLMATNGFRPQRVMRRIAKYKKYMTHPGALQMDIVQKYKDQVLQAELTAMSAASQSAPPGAKESRASRSGASQPAARRVKRSRDADDDPRPGDAACSSCEPGSPENAKA